MAIRTQQILGSVIGENVGRVTSVLGADTAAPSTSKALVPVAGGSAISKFLNEIGATRPRSIPDGIGTVGGAAIGYWYGRKNKHPYLYAIGGASLGRNVPALLNDLDRKVAMRNLLTTGSGIAAVLMLKFGHPAVRFLLGAMGGAVAAAYGGLE